MPAALLALQAAALPQLYLCNRSAAQCTAAPAGTPGAVSAAVCQRQCAGSGPCRRLSNCSACTARSDCGWCSQPGQCASIDWVDRARVGCTGRWAIEQCGGGAHENDGAAGPLRAGAGQPFYYQFRDRVFASTDVPMPADFTLPDPTKKPPQLKPLVMAPTAKVQGNVGELSSHYSAVDVWRFIEGDTMCVPLDVRSKLVHALPALLMSARGQTGVLVYETYNITDSLGVLTIAFAAARARRDASDLSSSAEFELGFVYAVAMAEVQSQGKRALTEAEIGDIRQGLRATMHGFLTRQFPVPPPGLALTAAGGERPLGAARRTAARELAVRGPSRVSSFPLAAGGGPAGAAQGFYASFRSAVALLADWVPDPADDFKKLVTHNAPVEVRYNVDFAVAKDTHEFLYFIDGQRPCTGDLDGGFMRWDLYQSIVDLAETYANQSGVHYTSQQETKVRTSRSGSTQALIVWVLAVTANSPGQAGGSYSLAYAYGKANATTTGTSPADVRTVGLGQESLILQKLVSALPVKPPQQQTSQR
eukprot:TRINITY_DN22397_c0_g1_i1.p1 TRINITY_DN22397_c0_g1~~TRINITY_DN22397_c0_g1_i1.p1  ORF type:complete len:563 (+),score=145.50 TRINITY_DN22397_c0_g1_i1:89-1690(+)